MTGHDPLATIFPEPVNIQLVGTDGAGTHAVATIGSLTSLTRPRRARCPSRAPRSTAALARSSMARASRTWRVRCAWCLARVCASGFGGRLARARERPCPYVHVYVHVDVRQPSPRPMGPRPWWSGGLWIARYVIVDHSNTMISYRHGSCGLNTLTSVRFKSLQWHGLCPDDMSHAIDMGQIHLTYCGI